MSSCWAEASDLSHELWHGRNWNGCCSRWWQVLGGNLQCCRFTSPFLLLCMDVTIPPQHCGRPVIRNRLIFRFTLEEYYPVWSCWDFSALIPELVESLLRAPVRHPAAWVPPSSASHSSATSPHTLPPPPVPPGQLSPWMWTLLLRWWQKQSVQSQPISPNWLLSWNMVAESGGRWSQKCPSCPPSHFAWPC